MNTDDQTYSTSSGSFYIYSTFLNSAPYADAGDCNDVNSSTGLANIDLRGTPFFVNDTFVTVGFMPAGAATFSSANQVVDMTCGGLEPAPGTGGFQLNLGFNGPNDHD